MPTEEQKSRVRSFVYYASLIAMGVAVCSVIIVGALLKQRIIAGRIFITIFWLIFASRNGLIFYTGEVSWRFLGEIKTLTRKHNPIDFYASSLSWAIASMSLCTFLLWKAYTQK